MARFSTDEAGTADGDRLMPGMGMAPSPPRTRISSLDALRLGAVLFVVMQHSLLFVGDEGKPGPLLLLLIGLAVPVIFAVAGFLDGAGEPKRTHRSRYERLYRLLVPYVCWATFYTMFFAIQALIKGVPVRLPSLPDILTGQGVYFILWFLPTLAACTLAGWTLPTPRRSLLGGFVGLATWVAANVAFAVYGISPGATDAGNVLFRLPYFIGWYLVSRAIGFAAPSSRLRASWIWLTVLVAAALTVSLMPDTAGQEGLPGAISDAVSSCLFGVAALASVLLAVRVPQLGQHLAPFWRSVAPYGIYLTHMLFLEAADKVLPHGAFDWRVHSALLTIIGFFGASAFVALSVRITALRPAFGLAKARDGGVKTAPATSADV